MAGDQALLSEWRIMGTWNVRKYSYLKSKSEWEHFPYRDNIVLAVDSTAFKISWNFTVLQEFDTRAITGLSIYTKSPSIGFKFNQEGQMKRFQLGFNEKTEFESVVEYLTINGLISPKHNRSLSVTASQVNLLPSSQQSQLSFGLTPDQVRNIMNAETESIPPTQMRPPLFQASPIHQYASHASFSQPQLPSLSQPPVPTAIFSPCTAFAEAENTVTPRRADENEVGGQFLSQIFNEPTTSPKVKDINYDTITDDEIKELLREKIKDINFINFVERIENCLKTLQ